MAARTEVPILSNGALDWGKVAHFRGSRKDFSRLSQEVQDAVDQTFQWLYHTIGDTGVESVSAQIPTNIPGTLAKVTLHRASPPNSTCHTWYFTRQPSLELIADPNPRRKRCAVSKATTISAPDESLRTRGETLREELRMAQENNNQTSSSETRSPTTKVLAVSALAAGAWYLAGTPDMATMRDTVDRGSALVASGASTISAGAQSALHSAASSAADGISAIASLAKGTLGSWSKALTHASLAAATGFCAFKKEWQESGEESDSTTRSDQKGPTAGGTGSSAHTKDDGSGSGGSSS